MIFTEAEITYLASQHLGRLATLAGDGTLQNNPVGFRVDAVHGWIEIGGWNMGESRKFKNILAHPEVAFVVDDLASVAPWSPRGIEIRGRAEAAEVDRPPGDQLSPEVIRIRPRRILTWSLDGQDPAAARRWIKP
jgi:pyridoxamine 5'-phosphate oxidase family protein